ncbi:DoxX family protein [Brevundimonas sp.]|uniref:DoxX family protein n=1 Tax=Brevundimonas sp. TaxID=1871086 RepID=UPI002D54806B|nr:DoxX family membrane protein [Brevundimonas sp.]HYC97462.1 DoxX family membrane protein [Brevundimonas sp.]
MRDFGDSVRLPGRLMLATGLIGFGLVSLYFHHPVDGLQPFDAPPPGVWLNGAVLLLGGAGLAWSRTARPAALALWGLLTALLFVHAPGLAATPRDAVRWVSALEVLGLLSAAMLVAAPGRDDLKLAARMAVGLMLIVFGAVHWMYVDAIAGLIPDWMPGRALWPWITGAANIAAGLALVSGVLARTASALVGAMFASWIVLVHLPRLLAAPGDRSEWVAGALAFALTGVAWTVHGALTRSGEDLQPSVR